MTKTITQYACEFCERVYDTKAEAQKCERTARAMKPRLEVGDIVLTWAGFGWFDGDYKWIANPEVAMDNPPRAGNVSTKGSQTGHGNCFGECCTYQFYYVVTAIDGGVGRTSVPHRVRYHIATKAMTGKQGHRGGYTFDDGHATLRKVENPPEHVRETSKELIGLVADSLL